MKEARPALVPRLAVSPPGRQYRTEKNTWKSSALSVVDILTFLLTARKSFQASARLKPKMDVHTKDVEEKCRRYNIKIDTEALPLKICGGFRMCKQSARTALLLLEET